jgi:hypothetical protein
MLAEELMVKLKGVLFRSSSMMDGETPANSLKSWNKMHLSK